MKRSNTKFKKQIIEYKLKDYEFLEDYEIIQANTVNKDSFIAKIKNSTQKVRFLKKKYSDEYFERFRTLYKLYKNGIVLADNMFIVEQCQELYFYIIQAQLQTKNSRFQHLHHYMYSFALNQQEKKAILVKIKILVDCLHQEGQYYGGLDSRNIIVDDQKHLFLTPFNLEIQLKRDAFSRAYYSLQILQKISKEQSQINEQLLLKWDMWSFGCISAEVLLYNSPIFLSTSLNNQIKMMYAFETETQAQKLQQNLKNISVNSLNMNIQRRSLAIEKIKDPKIKEQPKKEKQVRTVKQSTEIKRSHIFTNEVKQLNLYLQEEEGDSQLTLNLHCIDNIHFQNELHIIVHLDKKYHFYIDSKPSTAKYLLNKKLTIRRNFIFFLQLLDNPVKIQFKEGASSSIININLQTLALIHQGRRIWNKTLLGTYKNQTKGHFYNSNIKISCNLMSPETFIEEIRSKAIDPSCGPQTQHKQTIQQNKQPQVKIPQQNSIKQQNILRQIKNETVSKRKKKKRPINAEIPSISQISQSISLMNQQLKRKFLQQKQKDAPQDDIRVSLQHLLHIQH